LLTSTTQANVLTKVSLLFAIGMRLLLPIAFEVRPPPTFLLDSTPSPLHPALRPNQHGVNPFRSSSWMSQAHDVTDDSDSVSCPLFNVHMTSHASQDTVIPDDARHNSSICVDPPTLDRSMLRVCQPDTYATLPGALAQCKVIGNKAFVHIDEMGTNFLRQEYCTSDTCNGKLEYAWLPSGQYQITLRGYNPPIVPTTLMDNTWYLTVLQDVQVLASGEHNVIDPGLSAQLPGYDIDATAEYSDQISPLGGIVLRGSAGWLGLDNGEELTILGSAELDQTFDGHTVVLGGS